PDVKRDGIQHRTALNILVGKVPDREHHIARLGVRLLNPEQDLAAHHQARESLSRGARGWQFSDDAAVADNGDIVGERKNLSQLVSDYDYSLALAPEKPEDSKKALDLLRRQHSGRLVEDQNAGIPVQDLEYLDSLLLAYG